MYNIYTGILKIKSRVITATKLSVADNKISVGTFKIDNRIFNTVLITLFKVLRITVDQTININNTFITIDNE